MHNATCITKTVAFQTAITSIIQLMSRLSSINSQKPWYQKPIFYLIFIQKLVGHVQPEITWVVFLHTIFSSNTNEHFKYSTLETEKWDHMTYQDDLSKPYLKSRRYKYLSKYLNDIKLWSRCDVCILWIIPYLIFS